MVRVTVARDRVREVRVGGREEAVTAAGAFHSAPARPALRRTFSGRRVHHAGVCVYYCSTYYKAVREEDGGKWRTCATRDYEPGLCELVCPSRTSERGGEGYCVKEGGREEGERERERAVCVFITAGPVIKLCAGGRIVR